MDDDVVGRELPEPDDGPAWWSESGGGSPVPADPRVGSRRWDGRVLTSTGHWVEV